MSQITRSGRKILKALTVANIAFVQSALQTPERERESESVTRDGDVLACLHSFSLSNKEAAAFMATVLSLSWALSSLLSVCVYKITLKCKYK